MLEKEGFPRIHSLLGIGGMDMSSQLQTIRNGVHIVIGTPGRLSDMVNKKKINMDLCQYVVLDEADRMLDQVFELEIKNILEHFKVPHPIKQLSIESPIDYAIFGYYAEKDTRVC